MTLGDVPDIQGIQSWIEKAWGAGFDMAGKEEFGGQLLGSDYWIGATECAALLRYFGFRAIVVDFSMNRAEIETSERRKKDITAQKKRKKRRKQECADDDFTINKKKSTKKSKMKSSVFFNDAVSDNSEDDFEPYNIEDMQDEKIKNTINVNSDIVEIDCDDIEKEIIFEENVNNKKNSAKNEYSTNDNCSEIGNRLCAWILKYYSASKMLNVVAYKGVPTGMNLLSAPTSSSFMCNENKFSRNVVDLLDDENDKECSSFNQNSQIQSNGKSVSANSIDVTSNSIYTVQKSTSLPRLLPLYFQHQGHSRTIIGMENLNLHSRMIN